MIINRSLVVRKLKALAAHLSISAVLVLATVFLILTRWFPQPLFETDGGGVGLRLIVLVDLVLGPLLTFVVFNPAKSRREISLDLSLIGLLQLAAFGWGIHNIYQVRVETLAYHDGQFWTVTADTYASQKIDPGGWQALGARPPYVVDVRKPGNSDEASGVGAFAMMQGLQPYHLHFLYQPYAKAAKSHWDAGWSLADLTARHADIATQARAWAQGKSIRPESLRYYRVQGYFGAAVVAFDEAGNWLGGFAAALPKRAVATPSSDSPTS